VKDITLLLPRTSPLRQPRRFPGNLIEAERENLQGTGKGKPENVMEKIVEGKLEQILQHSCLLEQGFIKNPDETIGDLVKAKIAELGETS